VTGHGLIRCKSLLHHRKSRRGAVDATGDPCHHAMHRLLQFDSRQISRPPPRQVHVPFIILLTVPFSECHRECGLDRKAPHPPRPCWFPVLTFLLLAAPALTSADGFLPHPGTRPYCAFHSSHSLSPHSCLYTSLRRAHHRLEALITIATNVIELRHQYFHFGRVHGHGTGIYFSGRDQEPGTRTFIIFIWTLVLSTLA
jgi:hypothetical protein